MVPLAPAAIAMPMNREAQQTHIYICQHDHCMAFALIKDGKYAFAQFSNDDVPDPVADVWSVRDGAVPQHMSVRDVHEHEAVTVSGAKLMPKLYGLLNQLIAGAAQPKAA